MISTPYHSHFSEPSHDTVLQRFQTSCQTELIIYQLISHQINYLVSAFDTELWSFCDIKLQVVLNCHQKYICLNEILYFTKGYLWKPLASFCMLKFGANIDDFYLHIFQEKILFDFLQIKIFNSSLYLEVMNFQISFWNFRMFRIVHFENKTSTLRENALQITMQVWHREWSFLLQYFVLCSI